MHSRQTHLVVGSASVVVDSDKPETIFNYIHKNYNSIIKDVKKVAKNKIGYPKRTFPIKYIKVYVQCLNERVRNLRDSGLHENLICSICINNSPTIKDIDIHGAYEVLGKIRIVWNCNWSGYGGITKT